MIKARHTPFWVGFFRIYSLWMIRSHFSQVRLTVRFEEQPQPVLLIGNHFSWWDGFIANYLNIKIFRRRFHVMMLEEQLKARMFLNKAGAYSIMKGSRSMVETISYTAGLLSSPENLVTAYPQGKFQSVYEPSVRFEKGLISMLGKMKPSGYQVVFYVALVDYFSSRKPILSLYVKKFDFTLDLPAGDIEWAYNHFYRECAGRQKE
jgi:hypothetical protein